VLVVFFKVLPVVLVVFVTLAVVFFTVLLVAFVFIVVFVFAVVFAFMVPEVFADDLFVLEEFPNIIVVFGSNMLPLQTAVS